MSATETFVNLSEYPDPKSDEFYSLPPGEQYRLEDYHIFTRESTVVKTGTRVTSILWCDEEDEKGDLCEGDIELVRIEVPGEIRWKCRRCGQHGKITGFENGPGDLSDLPEEEASQIIAEMYGMDMDEENSMSFADFLDLESLTEEFDGDPEAFSSWFMNLHPEEMENFLDEMGGGYQ